MQSDGGETRKAQRTRVIKPEDLPEPPTTPEEVESCLRWCYGAIASGELDAVTGRATSDTLKTLHAAMSARLGHEERIKGLQKLVKELQEAKPR